MEFRIEVHQIQYKEYHGKAKLPSELTVSERVELIKQLCPNIGLRACEWAIQNKQPISFLDYLVEYMEVKE